MIMIVRNYDVLYNNCIEIMVMMIIVRNYVGLYNRDTGYDDDSEKL